MKSSHAYRAQRSDGMREVGQVSGQTLKWGDPKSVMGMRIHPTESYNSAALEGMSGPCVTWISGVLGEKNKVTCCGEFFLLLLTISTWNFLDVFFFLFLRVGRKTDISTMQTYQNLSIGKFSPQITRLYLCIKWGLFLNLMTHFIFIHYFFCLCLFLHPFPYCIFLLFIYITFACW